jgi:hypothetical protein
VTVLSDGRGSRRLWTVLRVVEVVWKIDVEEVGLSEGAEKV